MSLSKKRGKSNQGALTLVEVLVIIAVLLVAAGMILPMFSVPRTKSSRIKCVNNLKNVGLAFRIFATDNNNHFPMGLSKDENGTREWIDDPTQVWRHFASMSNELSTPKILLCRDDNLGRIEATTFTRTLQVPRAEVFSRNANLSYFVGVDATEKTPGMLLAGDRNLTNGGANVFAYGLARVGDLGTNHTARSGAGWDSNVHRHAGNVTLGDGSVQQLTTQRLRELLRGSPDPHNRVAVPD